MITIHTKGDTITEIGIEEGDYILDLSGHTGKNFSKKALNALKNSDIHYVTIEQPTYELTKESYQVTEGGYFPNGLESE